MPLIDPEAIAPIIGGEIVGALTLMPGTTIQDNEYGIDVMVRPFFGMADEIKDIAPKRGERDNWEPNFICTDRSFIYGKGCTATALVTYKGLLGSDLPPPTVKGGWREASAQLSTTRNYGKWGDLGMLNLGMGNAGGAGGDSVTPTSGATGTAGDASTLTSLIDSQSGEVTVTYNSPTTTFMYISRKEPKRPKYRGVLLTSDNDFEIIEIQPASFRGRPIANPEIRTMEFEKNKVGLYWEVMEVNQGILTSLSVAYRGAKTVTFPPGYKPKQLNLR